MPKKLPRQFCFAKISKYQPEQICQAVWNNQKYLVTWEDGVQSTLYEKQLLSKLEEECYGIITADIRYRDFGDYIVRVVLNKDGTCILERKSKWAPTNCACTAIEYSQIDRILDEYTRFYQVHNTMRELAKQIHSQTQKMLQHKKYDWLTIFYVPGIGYSLSQQEPRNYKIGDFDDLTAFLIENHWEKSSDWIVTDALSIEEKQITCLMQALHTNPDIAADLLNYLNLQKHTKEIGILPTEE